MLVCGKFKCMSRKPDRREERLQEGDFFQGGAGKKMGKTGKELRSKAEASFI